ncbi:MoxR family ATPase [Synechococcus sp. RSCCF101]|uniref:AAA family ATPase n=1 Tax=Synechococcus sp. RSCCF101 TaxID=2511069 RepID=UPI0012487C5D|nr:MoxR family ATPase [Synechococcus sp. RSCCF101]QEY32813.1 MoxR family ATPase [Synechococcus sp. RSCCF101]
MAERIAPLLEQINGVLLGKERPVRLAVTCLLAGGHLLIEDLPGVGKTTLAEALARSFGLAFQRVHFTSDLLPADLTGLRLFDQGKGAFRFEPGPVFSQVLLADEINRASPRTQSALLEAMASGRVSVDGTSHDLPRPFFVIATQNGLDQGGTSPLPESQLDRFEMRLSLGFPPRRAERELLSGQQHDLNSLGELIPAGELRSLQQQVGRQHASETVIDYLLDLVAVSRERGRGHAPLSPRASQALLRCARAWSLLEERAYVTINDVQEVMEAVCEHRLDGGRPEENGAHWSPKLLTAVDGLR